jgi:hypothetical protein
MDFRSLRARLVLAGVAVVVAACSGQAPPAGQARQHTAQPRIGYANIGGYRLAYECAGTGRPAVILEAGYTASGIDTYGRTILPALARRTRVCTYDRAGDGLSDARPASVRPLTGGHAGQGAAHSAARDPRRGAVCSGRPLLWRDDHPGIRGALPS